MLAEIKYTLPSKKKEDPEVLNTNKRRKKLILHHTIGVWSIYIYL